MKDFDINWHIRNPSSPLHTFADAGDEGGTGEDAVLKEVKSEQGKGKRAKDAKYSQGDRVPIQETAYDERLADRELVGLPTGFHLEEIDPENPPKPSESVDRGAPRVVEPIPGDKHQFDPLIQGSLVPDVGESDDPEEGLPEVSVESNFVSPSERRRRDKEVREGGKKTVELMVEKLGLRNIDGDDELGLLSRLWGGANFSRRGKDAGPRAKVITGINPAKDRLVLSTRLGINHDVQVEVSLDSLRRAIPQDAGISLPSPFRSRDEKTFLDQLHQLSLYGETFNISGVEIQRIKPRPEWNKDRTAVRLIPDMSDMEESYAKDVRRFLGLWKDSDTEVAGVRVVEGENGYARLVVEGRVGNKTRKVSVSMLSLAIAFNGSGVRSEQSSGVKGVDFVDVRLSSGMKREELMDALGKLEINGVRRKDGKLIGDKKQKPLTKVEGKVVADEPKVEPVVVDYEHYRRLKEEAGWKPTFSVRGDEGVSDRPTVDMSVDLNKPKAEAEKPSRKVFDVAVDVEKIEDRYVKKFIQRWMQGGQLTVEVKVADQPSSQDGTRTVRSIQSLALRGEDNQDRVEVRNIRSLMSVLKLQPYRIDRKHPESGGKYMAFGFKLPDESTFVYAWDGKQTGEGVLRVLGKLRIADSGKPGSNVRGMLRPNTGVEVTGAVSWKSQKSGSGVRETEKV